MNITAQPVDAPNKMVNILKQCLATNQALDLKAIIGRVDLEREQVVDILARLVQNREVEVLCPVSIKHDHTQLTLHPLEHYRLVRPTDGDYLWQTHIRENHVRIHLDALEDWAEEPELSERALDFNWLWPKTYAYSVG